MYFWDGYTNPEHPERGDLNGDIAHGKKGSDIKVPSIVIWNKSQAGSPVVGELSWTLAEAENETAYKAALRSLFDKISNGTKTASSVSVTPGQYFEEFVTNRFLAKNDVQQVLLDINGAAIKAPDGSDLLLKDWRLFPDDTKESPFEIVTYDELRGILASEGNYVILFGGLWCPNTHSTLRAIYDYATEYNISKIYFFDPELDSAGNNTATSLRNSNRTLTSPLYIDLFNNVLTNIGTGDLRTRFDVDYDNFITSIEIRKAEGRLIAGDPEDNAVNYDANGKLTDAAKLEVRLRNGASDGYSIYEKVPGKTSDADDYAPVENAKWAHRIHYPTLITYNKDHKDAAGNSAPVMKKFEQLWVSGGGNTPNPGINSYGRLSIVFGRLYEFTEYALNDSSKATASHNSAANNAQTPKTNQLILDSYVPPLVSADEFDPRGVNTPITSRTYWVGLLDIFGSFTASALEAEIAQWQGVNASDYTAESYAALQTALTGASDVVSAVNDNAQKAQSWVLEKLSAPLNQVRMSAQAQIVPYEDYSKDVAAAQNALVTAINGLTPVSADSASPTTPADNAPSGGNSNLTLIIGLAVVLVVAAVAVVLFSKKKPKQDGNTK